jgi:hypothetical protein
MVSNVLCAAGIRSLLSASLITIFAFSMVSAKKMQRIPTGVWGGPHVNINVSSKSATIAFDCAHGTITGPLVMDSKGHFSWEGTYTMERGGPVRMDEKANDRPAAYTGSIKGQSMTLTVKLTEQEEAIDTFVLTHGKTGRIVKCM